MKDQVNGLLNKQMDRKDFLKHVGMGFAILTGVAGVVKAFKSPTAVSKGYGASAYGGNKPVLGA